MRDRKLLKLTITVCMSALLAFALAACGGENTGKAEGGAGDAAAELTATDLDSLMDQIAEQEITKEYADYLPDEAFANAEVFGVDRDGDVGTAYVMLNTAEYAALRGKAYMMSGSQGNAIVTFGYTEDGPQLKEVEWSADGEESDTWMKDHYPERYRKAAERYEAYDKDGRSLLETALIPKVEKKMGVAVEAENQLEIDLEAGTYEIVKTIESGKPANDDYEFDTETIEKGKLSDLNS